MQPIIGGCDVLVPMEDMGIPPLFQNAKIYVLDCVWLIG